MMRSVVIWFTSLLMVAVAIGCTGAQRAGGTYTADLGRAPSQQIMSETAIGVLQSYGYQLQRSSRRSIETEWRTRGVSTALQQQEGYTEARDRARVRINQRGTNMFTARLTMTHEVRTEAGNWTRHPPSESALEEYEAMEEEMEDRLERYMVQN